MVVVESRQSSFSPTAYKRRHGKAGMVASPPCTTTLTTTTDCEVAHDIQPWPTPSPTPSTLDFPGNSRVETTGLGLARPRFQFNLSDIVGAQKISGECFDLLAAAAAALQHLGLDWHDLALRGTPPD